MSRQGRIEMSGQAQNTFRSASLVCSCSGCGSLGVKVLDRGWLAPSSSPVPLKTHRVGQQCTLNLSRAQTSSRYRSVVVRRGSASSGVVLVT
ncbi:hypothetical protein TNCV_3918901 [Trichonephila clavipes]|nr:hypothetical protein TNCV_3918901 [Trichonephila clavipes]